MSTRSSSSNLAPPFIDPESVIQHSRRNFGDPSRLLDFKEINMNSNNIEGPPPARPTPQYNNGPPGPNLHMPAPDLRTMEELCQPTMNGRGGPIAPVIGVVVIQPFFGGEERTNSEVELEGTPIVSTKITDWYWNAFLPPGEGHNRDHPIINVSGPNAVDISNMDFPPTIVVVAGFDALRDWQKRYYEWLKKSGKEVYFMDYPNMCHAFYLFPELPESGKLISEVKEFINKVLLKLLDSDSTLPEELSESSEIATLSSSPFENKDKVFNPGILILGGTQIFNDESKDKDLILEEHNFISISSDQELLFRLDLSVTATLLSFSYENYDKIFNPGIPISKEVHFFNL
nr:probable carboxylesterase 18 [Tanacetum cinerariifolium]